MVDAMLTENAKRREIEHIIENSLHLRSFCTQWTNGLIASQYMTPYRIVSKYLSSEKKLKVLDWGCGDGHLSYFLCKKKNLQVNAFSFDDLGKISSLFSQFFQKNFVFHKGDYADPVNLPLANGTFDAIFSMGVLEHVRETGGNEVSSLKELYRVLKPGGLLFVFHFPNRYSWIEMVNRQAVKLKLTSKYVHNFLYRKNDIKHLSDEAGFELLETGLYNLFPRNLFRSLSPAIANNKFVIRAFQMFEGVFSVFLKNFSQNNYVVLKKPE